MRSRPVRVSDHAIQRLRERAHVDWSGHDIARLLKAEIAKAERWGALWAWRDGQQAMPITVNGRPLVVVLGADRLFAGGRAVVTVFTRCAEDGATAALAAAEGQ